MLKILIIGASGYIGVPLTQQLRKNYQVDTMDIRSYKSPTYRMDYKDITIDIVQLYDIIILLAGNSSVKSSENMWSTFQNNCISFIHLLDILPMKTKLIYASSSSVYGKTQQACVDETYKNQTPYNYYDASKNMIDTWAELSGKRVYGLRFGTVNGYSPNFRNDVMINAMVHNLMIQGVFYIYSKHTRRAILGLLDLIRAVESIVRDEKNNIGIYNLASFNASVREIATDIQRITGMRYQELETPTIIQNSKLETSSYDFEINCDKFCNTFDFTFYETTSTITESILKQYALLDINKGRITDTYTQSVGWTCREVEVCRVCSGTLIDILDLGDQPLANQFHNKTEKLSVYPLCLRTCKNCTHLQLSHVVNPYLLYNNYILCEWDV